MSDTEIHTTMNYGEIPTREAFDAAFERECPNGFQFGNDPYVGFATLDSDDTWAELEAQLATWENGEHDSDCPGDGECSGHGCPCEEAGSWCSCVLGCLGFEWV